MNNFICELQEELLVDTGHSVGYDYLRELVEPFMAEFSTEKAEEESLLASAIDTAFEQQDLEFSSGELLGPSLEDIKEMRKPFQSAD